MRTMRAAVPGPGWGRFVLEAAVDPPPPGVIARSYDSRGHRLGWLADAGPAMPFPAACDIEWRGRFPGSPVANLSPAGLDVPSFWVLAELAAKLLDLPMLEWVRRYRTRDVPALPAGAEALLVPRWADAWTLGFARIAPRDATPPPSAGGMSPWGFGAGRVAVRGATGPIAGPLDHVSKPGFVPAAVHDPRDP